MLQHAVHFHLGSFWNNFLSTTEKFACARGVVLEQTFFKQLQGRLAKGIIARPILFSTIIPFRENWNQSVQTGSSFSNQLQGRLAKGIFARPILFSTTPEGKTMQILDLHRLGHELAYNAGVLCVLACHPLPDINIIIYAKWGGVSSAVPSP